MKQYIRTNDEGAAVLDYDELDTAAQINFLEDAERAAAALELDLDDPDFSNAEKAESINNAAALAATHAFGDLETKDGEEVEIDPDTQLMFIDAIINVLAERYDVEVA